MSLIRSYQVQQRLLVPWLCQRAYAASGSVGSLFKSYRTRPRRNPRIIPHAKVKAFKVRPCIDPDPETVAHTSEHTSHYEMQMDALKHAFYYELHGRLLLPGESAFAGLQQLTNKEEHLEDSNEAKRRLVEVERINADWNMRSAEYRETEMRSQLDNLRDMRDRLELDAELANKATVLSFQTQLKRDLAESADFIDEFNLDAKIEAIIDSPIVDFSFAVDPAGSVVCSGSQVNPPSVDPPSPPSPEELSVSV